MHVSQSRGEFARSLKTYTFVLHSLNRTIAQMPSASRGPPRGEFTVLRDVAHACVTLLLLVTPPLRCARQCAIGRTWLAMPMARVVVFNVYFLLRSSSHIRVYVVCIVPVATPTVYFRHASYSYSRYSLSLSSLLMHNNYISPSLYVLVVGALEVPSSSSFTSSPASSSCSSMMSNSQ